MRGGRVGSLAASPTLVGAVTVLVVVVAVFLSYQANQGLPFVPTYKISAELPNADTLVPGNDVRIGGIRVGQIKSIQPETVNNAPCPNDPTRQCTTQVAKVNLELDQNLNPLPENSTVVVRAKSALGLKYLEVDRGTSTQGFKPGSTMPLTAARPEPVEIDQVFNMFDSPTRTAIQTNLLEFGNALAGRGVDLNEAIGQLKPLVELLTPVMKNLADPATGLSNFVSSLSATAAEVAPVAEIQGQLFADLDTTFAAFARVSRPFIQETISRSPAAEDTAIATLPTIRPFLANTAKLFSELRPGFHALAPQQKPLGQSVVEGVKALALAPAFNAQLDPTAQAILNLANNSGARQGINDLTDFNNTLGPPLAFITPAQSVCNYATLLFRNVASYLSFGDGIGTSQRFIVLQPPIGPGSAIGPAASPANGGGQDSNFLHYNPYPNTASPGQPRECEAGNEGFPGGVTIGNIPGNQGIHTEGQILQQVTKKKPKKKGKK
ncbi:MAG: phospholipid/cholesterol/gamma-HCH transport system substrate-binding protein [Solirubrobacterales bacterium]|jgi:virulence factor Mce-like protein|nr:phospholipid/cholesterol/gamma-HCH transport system substrate-binding protein [Solirubrobacterales bacterium]